MKDSNKNARTFVRAFMVMILCWPLLLLATPGSIPREGAPEHMAAYRQEMEKWTLFSTTPSSETPLLIGHRAGAYLEYPTNVSSLAKKGKVLDIAVLMDRAFGELTLSGIEIDLQLWRPAPGEAPQVVIMHDPVPSSPESISREARDYMEKNTLEKVLRHYLDQGYHRQGKKIYLEIKIPGRTYKNHPRLFKQDEIYLAEIMKGLSAILKNHPEADLIKKELIFVSFNFFALEKLAVLGATEGIHLDSYLIATTNIPYFWPFAKAGKLPIMNPFLLKLVRSSPHLTGLWFSPKWVQDFSVVFNGLNKGRKTPLSYHVATYETDFPKFKSMMEKESRKEKLKEVAGLIFDIRKGP